MHAALQGDAASHCNMAREASGDHSAGGGRLHFSCPPILAGVEEFQFRTVDFDHRIVYGAPAMLLSNTRLSAI